MNKTTASGKTPSPDEKKSVVPPVEKHDSPRQMFMIAALNMSWQLAIVVLVPVIGGFKLDQKLETLPALTIIGFIIAIAGMVVVVNRELKRFAPPENGGKK